MNSTTTLSGLSILAFVMTTWACAAQRVASRVEQTSIQEIEVVTAGATAEFQPTACGRVITFSGRALCRLDDGTVRPVLDAMFWYEAPTGRRRTQLDVIVDAQGSFSGTIWIEESGFSFLTQEGVYQVETAAGTLPLIVTAEGCADRHIEYDDEWQSQDLYLVCNRR